MHPLEAWLALADVLVEDVPSSGWSHHLTQAVVLTGVWAARSWEKSNRKKCEQDVSSVIYRSVCKMINKQAFFRNQKKVFSAVYLSLSGCRYLPRSHLHRYRWMDRPPPLSRMLRHYGKDSPHSSHLRKKGSLLCVLLKRAQCKYKQFSKTAANAVHSQTVSLFFSTGQ